jgi:putative ABC transport system substrate-binding protein
MKRRDFVAALCGALAWPLAARAQQGAKNPGKLPSVGFIDVSPRISAIDGLLTGLRDLGYVDGRNVRLVGQRSAGPTVQQSRDAIQALIPDADVLVVTGTIGGVAAKSLNPDIPVVFISVGAPVDIGLVKSLAKPGGNMTGVTFEAAEETYAKRLQLLAEIVPGLKRVAVLGSGDDPNFAFAMVSLQQSAPALGVSISRMALKSADDLRGAFEAMKQTDMQALLVVAGSLTYENVGETARLALANRLPSCHGFWEAVTAGGLISLGPDLLSLGRQSARLVDKIIKGEHPRDIPVEQPDRYVMHVNLATAKALGLTVPPSLLARADEVIE